MYEIANGNDAVIKVNVVRDDEIGDLSAAFRRPQGCLALDGW
ncbi:hypothetical protein BACCIP111895_00777 [Neobacillus rhizosphaerae]|uniref:Uncharacterized protein n=1 Tax=Neobacillus rhizosphaerae TaxID=2880965 RepID=A0ABM9EM05_9BACI|nr:hypothetical protein BACCIP111895_00777 [Neobacillus rhizosphaerae]